MGLVLQIAQVVTFVFACLFLISGLRQEGTQQKRSMVNAIISALFSVFITLLLFGGM